VSRLLIGTFSGVAQFLRRYLAPLGVPLTIDKRDGILTLELDELASLAASLAKYPSSHPLHVMIFLLAMRVPPNDPNPAIAASAGGWPARIVRAAVRPPAKIASNKISALRTVGSGGRSSTLTFGVLLREGP
jgi:hypothetical protein